MMGNAPIIQANIHRIRWQTGPDFQFPLGGPDTQQSYDSFRVGYLQNDPPVGFRDLVYIRHSEGVESEDIAFLYTVITDARPDGFITFNGLKEGHPYFIRIYRYLGNDLIGVSNREHCFTFPKYWPVASSTYVEDYSHPEDFYSNWYNGNGYSCINYGAFAYPSWEIPGKFTLTGRPIWGEGLYLWYLPVDSPLPNDAWRWVNAETGLAEWQNFPVSCFTSRNTWNLRDKDYEIEWTFSLDDRSANPYWTICHCLYNGEGQYLGLYMYGCQRSGPGAVEDPPFAWHWRLIGDGYVGQFFGGLPQPFVPGQEYHIKMQVVNRIVSFSVNDVILVIPAPMMNFTGPVSLWAEYDFGANSTPIGSALPDFNNVVHVGPLKVTVLTNPVQIAGFYDWQNISLINRRQSGYPGFAMCAGQVEDYHFVPCCLTARTPDGQDYDVWMETYAAGAETYALGAFGGRLPIIVQPSNGQPLLMRLWGRQKAGYLKIRLYNADTEELIPENELPGNVVGFLPNNFRNDLLGSNILDFGADKGGGSDYPSLDRLDSLYLCSTDIDISKVTATSFYMELDGYYDGTDYVDIVESWLYDGIWTIEEDPVFILTDPPVKVSLIKSWELRTPSFLCGASLEFSEIPPGGDFNILGGASLTAGSKPTMTLTATGTNTFSPRSGVSDCNGQIIQLSEVMPEETINADILFRDLAGNPITVKDLNGNNIVFRQRVNGDWV